MNEQRIEITPVIMVKGQKGDPGPRGLPGNGISEIRLIGTSGNVSTYQIVFDNGETTEYTVKDGNGIASIDFVSSDGLVDTYAITYTNGDVKTFTVTNGAKGDKGDKGDNGDTGNGIVSIRKTSSSGLVDTYTVTYTDGNTDTITVTNGEKGEKGEKGDTGDTGNGIRSVTSSKSGDTTTVTVSMTDGTSVSFQVKDGEKGDTGEPFTIFKTYPSVAEMNAGYSTDGVPIGGFVVIDSSVADPDNAKLYLKESSAYKYITDLSGAQGIKGDKGDKGDTGETGATGNGISAITLTSTVGLVKTYTVTYTNGSTTTFQVTDGAKGDTGEKGEKGEKGDKGDKGEKGDNGANGSNGVGISSITKVSTEGLVDTYQINLTDGSHYSFTVTNADSSSLDYYTAEEIDSAMFGTYTVTGSITNGTSTSATIIARTSATATITITPSTGYTLPASVTVTNATLTSYDDTTGIVTVSNPNGDVVVTAVCEAITYSITTTVTNGTYSGATSISYGGTATITIAPNSTYSLPSSITVTGASYTYDSATGVVSLSNPTGAVSITAVCESAQTMPVKGQIITMTLGNTAPAAGTQNTYRVLKIDGSIAEVVAMFDQSTSQKFNPSQSAGNAYSGSSLDTYLNTTWYNSLNATAKSAIVAKSVQQYRYSYNPSVYNATTDASYADYSTKAAKGSAVSKYVYALDVEDIETYFGGTFSTANIWTLFWNTTSKPSTPTYLWLRSADADSSDSAFYVFGGDGRVRSSNVAGVAAARPAFTIDLSKISWA